MDTLLCCLRWNRLNRQFVGEETLLMIWRKEITNGKCLPIWVWQLFLSADGPDQVNWITLPYSNEGTNVSMPRTKMNWLFSSNFLMKRISGLLSQHAAHDDEDGLAADGESPSLGCSDATLSDPDDLFCCTSLPLTSTRWVRSTIKLFALSTVSKRCQCW